MQTSKRIALIDGDILVYRTGFAGQKTIHTARSRDGSLLGVYKNKTELQKDLAEREQVPHEVTTHIELDSIRNVLHTCRRQLGTILKQAGCQEYRLFLTGAGNFREQVATTAPYKGNRVAAKPVYYQQIRRYMENRFGAEVINGMEADDAISILMAESPDQYVCCTIDKDLKQCPGWHLNWDKDAAPTYVTPDEAEYSLWRQVLSGDPTDNIPGIPGVGDKTAEKILQEGLLSGLSYENIAIAAYQTAYGDGSGKILGEMYRLVKLLTSEEEFETKAQRDSRVQKALAAKAERDMSALQEQD